MADKPEIQSGPTKGADVTTVMVRTLIGTTWRMFVPSIGLTIIGLVLDQVCGTKPWLMLIGIFLGFGLAAGLVWLQIRQLKSEGVTK